MHYHMWVGSAFAAIAAFVAVQTAYLVSVGAQLIGAAAWDLSITALTLTGVATISLFAQNRIMRVLTRRIDLMERRAIMNAAGGDDDDPRYGLRVVR